MKKQMISLRFDPNLITLLKRVQETPNTIFYEKDRTWLIEKAVKEYFKMYKQNGDNDENST